ncbi:serine protease 42-like [Anopheles nili]|uniref:serine protease 42-like n=1 Tax=Anopheles nili TaxID=185578 RepID=UPI00237AAA57|nr:serine protease 42-like [Anopheles nili]
MGESRRIPIRPGIVVPLLIVCFLIESILSAALNGDRRECTTANNKTGYCMPRDDCVDGDIVDLRVITSDCQDTTLFCCSTAPKASAPSPTNPALTECDNHRGYCVNSHECRVRTYRLRTNRCPSYHDVCCPKSSLPEMVSIVSADTVSTLRPVATTSSIPVWSYSRLSTTTPSSMTKKPAEFRTTTPSTTDDSTEPECTSPDCFNVEENVNHVLNSGISQTAAETVASQGTNASEGDGENNNIVPTSTPKTLIEMSPSSTTSQSTSSVTDEDGLVSSFAPENFSFQECGHRNPYGVMQRTVNETARAEYGEFPWTVALFQLPQQRYCCNGALIDESFVLTTAHCINWCGGPLAKVVARVGEWNMSARAEMVLPRKNIGVKSVHLHPQFGPTSLINNIAVIELERPVRYQATVQPVCLPSSEYPLRSTENMIATGWGKTMSSASPHVLKRLDLQHLDVSICQDKLKSIQHPYKFSLHESFMCTTTSHPTEERPCEGDAGSPVVVEFRDMIDRYYLHGLVSWGYGCHQQTNRFTVLTKVENFVEWIQEVMGGVYHE